MTSGTFIDKVLGLLQTQFEIRTRRGAQVATRERAARTFIPPSCRIQIRYPHVSSADHHLNSLVSYRNHKSHLNFSHSRGPPWPNLPTLLMRSNPLGAPGLAPSCIIDGQPGSRSPPLVRWGVDSTWCILSSLCQPTTTGGRIHG